MDRRRGNGRNRTEWEKWKIAIEKGGKGEINPRQLSCSRGKREWRKIREKSVGVEGVDEEGKEGCVREMATGGKRGGTEEGEEKYSDGGKGGWRKRGISG